MYILALNCGSSSLKYQLFDVDTREVLVAGNAEKIGLDDSFISQKLPTKEKTVVKMANHGDALNSIMGILHNASIDTNEIKGVGHRVLLGGSKFTSSVEITDDVVRTIRDYGDIAPLHNIPAVYGIEMARQILPNAKQVAVFDTAFHRTMPDYAETYAIPASWTREFDIKRYGFHGTSHLYVSKRAAAMLGKPASECNLITLHIGSGASAAAIKNGKCIDTSMGFTPITGLSMGTRPGDLDSSVVLYIMDKKNLDTKQMTTYLNKMSGMMGITECYSDRRDVEENKGSNDACRLALDMEILNVKKYIGAYMAELGGNVDAIVFTAGVGENDDWLREQYCSGLEGMGIKLDKKLNSEALARKGYGDTIISTPDSKVKIMMIPTNEELVIMEDTLAIMNGNYNPDHLKMDYSFAKLNNDKQR